MHHFWKVAVAYATATDVYTMTFTNKKSKTITLDIPKKGFWSSNDDVDDQQAQMLASAIQFVFNSTSG